MKDIVDFIKGFDLHAIITVGVAFWWLNSSLNGSINELEMSMQNIEKRLGIIEKDVAVIKTVLQLHKILPDNFVKGDSVDHN